MRKDYCESVAKKLVSLCFFAKKLKIAQAPVGN